MKKVAFYTLGCKVNQYETEVMREAFAATGYEIVDFEEIADIYIINSCSVTAIADRKSRRAIKKAASISPSSVIAVTGCYAQTSPGEVEKLPFVDIVVGNSEKAQIVAIVENASAKKQTTFVSDIMKNKSYLSMSASSGGEKTRALMKIQDGCDNFCSYCIIPYARGPVRSRPLNDIVKEAEALAGAGYKEIVLTGIHITSYGKDLESYDLSDVLLALHKVDGIERIRLGSLELTPVVEKIAGMARLLPRLCPHFHMSLQSGSDSVLKRMNRRYTSAEYLDAVKKIYSVWPDAAITTDIMVGFPRETEEEAAESRAFALECGFAKIHVFPYSVRKGTVAAKMDGQIDAETKKKRAAGMQQVADSLEKAYYDKNVGKRLSVLFEQEVSPNVFEGHSRNYMVVRAKSDKNVSGKVLSVIITSSKGNTLEGEII